jgi:hypothetical protein
VTITHIGGDSDGRPTWSSTLPTARRELVVLPPKAKVHASGSELEQHKAARPRELSTSLSPNLPNRLASEIAGGFLRRRVKT